MADRRGGGGSGRGGDRADRSLKTRVKTAKGRKLSSTRWLERQLNDPYVRRAQREGFRSRAAYKLLEIDDKRRLLKPGLRVLDLGAAPGGWSQVAAARVNAAGRPGARRGLVLGVDLLAIDPIADVRLMQLDFLADDAEEAIRAALVEAGAVDGARPEVDLVLSDMAAATTGHKATDHLRIVALAEAAALFACELLAEGGGFVAKVLQGGTEGSLLTLLKTRFASVAHVKPPASRSGSAESYVVATGFRGGDARRAPR
ncbi:MAG: RlmE family RNA methyltransferase [Pseudomonadota bacterium]